MAWLYLLLVILVFYTPAVGVGPSMLQRDWELSISGLRVPVPFTGALWLLLGSGLCWGALWAFTRGMEKRTGFDIFYWLDAQLPFLRLRERWIYASRPPTSLRLAVRLAEIGLALSLIKVVGILLLGVLLAVAVPHLIQVVLPNLIASLMDRFAGAGWVEILVDWLGGALTEWLAGSVIGWLRDALAIWLKFDLQAGLFNLSLLIILADQAYQKEREERYQKEIQRIQRKRKQAQQDIVITFVKEESA